MTRFILLVKYAGKPNISLMTFKVNETAATRNQIAESHNIMLRGIGESLNNASCVILFLYSSKLVKLY